VWIRRSNEIRPQIVLGGRSSFLDCEMPYSQSGVTENAGLVVYVTSQ